MRWLVITSGVITMMDRDVARMTIGRFRTMTILMAVLSPLSLGGVVLGVVVLANGRPVTGLPVVVCGAFGIVLLIKNAMSFASASTAIRRG
jgi:hypothetical protein